jgi:hypothetical protein
MVPTSYDTRCVFRMIKQITVRETDLRLLREVYNIDRKSEDILSKEVLLILKSNAPEGRSGQGDEYLTREVYNLRMKPGTSDQAEAQHQEDDAHFTKDVFYFIDRDNKGTAVEDVTRRSC